MKKVKYIATMVVEFEIDEEVFPDGFNKEDMIEEMKSDIFDELFTGELSHYSAKGLIIENDKVVAEHTELFD